MNSADVTLIAASIVNALIAVALWLLKGSLARNMRQLDERFDHVDDRFDKSDDRLESMTVKVDRLSSNLAQKETQIALLLRDVGALTTRQDKLEDKVEGRHDHVKAELKEFKSFVEAELRLIQRLHPVPYAVPPGRPPHQP